MMKMKARVVVITGVLALTAAPAFAAQDGMPPHGKGKGSGPVYTPGDPIPGPKAGLPAQAKAYGRHCQGESKKHVKGEKGTEFSRCVKAAAKLQREQKEAGS
jgi:hypothetical protein